MREPNILLDAIIDEAGMSHGGLAARVNRLGERDGLGLLYDHASVRRWIRDGTIPRGRAPELICEVLSMRLGRTVMLADIGMDLDAGGQGDAREPAGAGRGSCSRAVAQRRQAGRGATGSRAGARPGGGRAGVRVGEPTRRCPTWPGAQDAGSMALRCASCAPRGRGMNGCIGRQAEFRCALGSWPSSMGRPHRCSRAGMTTPLAGSCTGRWAASPPSPGSAPTTLTCRGWRSGTSSTPCAWPRLPATGASADTLSPCWRTRPCTWACTGRSSSMPRRPCEAPGST